MAKTAVGQADRSNKRVCTIHHTPLKLFKGKWVCELCLRDSDITYQTQREAIERYNKSPEGREAAKKYEQSDKGKETRNKYLKGEKYKAARKAYNQRLKESLAIARAGLATGTTTKSAMTPELRKTMALDGLIAEIREYINSHSKVPSAKSIIETAKRDYNTTIDEKKAQELIDQVTGGHRGSRA